MPKILTITRRVFKRSDTPADTAAKVEGKIGRELTDGEWDAVVDYISDYLLPGSIAYGARTAM